jgi:hypothetical protein
VLVAFLYNLAPLFDLEKCGPTFCDSLANQYNAANMAGRKHNTKTMAMVKIKRVKI